MMNPGGQLMTQTSPLQQQQPLLTSYQPPIYQQPFNPQQQQPPSNNNQFYPEHQQQPYFGFNNDAHQSKVMLGNYGPFPPPVPQQQQHQQQQPIYYAHTNNYPVAPPWPYCYPIYEPPGNNRHLTLEFDTTKKSCCCKKVDDSCSCQRAVNDEESLTRAICSKPNCPGAISLQSLAAQLLAIDGVISCLATRLLLKKIPGTNINNTPEEIVQRAHMCIEQMNRDHLLNEAKNAQQVNAIIHLHIVANPPANVIPILTSVQLKVALLKTQVDKLINAKMLETQGVGQCSEWNPAHLAIRTDSEIRRQITQFRERECEERVNVNFAPYHSQRAIAETKLATIQSRVCMLEKELERRLNSQGHTPIVVNNREPTCCVKSLPNFTNNNSEVCKSPDPFVVRVRNPKRLYFKKENSDVSLVELTPNVVIVIDGNSIHSTGDDQEKSNNTSKETKKDNNKCNGSPSKKQSVEKIDDEEKKKQDEDDVKSMSSSCDSDCEEYECSRRN